MRCSGNEKLVELVFEHEWGRSIGVTVASRLWIRTKQVSSSHISIIGLNSSWTYFLFIDQCVYEIENWAQTVDWNTPLPATWSKRVISKIFYFLSSSVHHKWHWRCWSWVTGYLKRRIYRGIDVNDQSCSSCIGLVSGLKKPNG